MAEQVTAQPLHPAWRGARLQLLGTSTVWLPLLVAVLIALFAQVYLVSLLSQALIYVSLALGLQVIAGQAGQVSLGHAAFFGVGAYTSALLTHNLGVPFPLALLAAAAAGAVGGIIMSPTVRIHGVYFAVATLAFGIVVNLFFVNAESLTGGARGFAGIPAASLGPISLASQTSFCIFVIAVVGLQYVSLHRLERGRFGRALKCIRENELAARSIGIEVVRYKVKAIVIGCAWAGVAGSLMAHYLRVASPEMFTLQVSIDIITMVVVGGLGSPAGAVVGGLLITVITTYLTPLGVISGVIDGFIILLAVMFLPGGLVGLGLTLWRRLPAQKAPLLAAGDGAGERA